MSSFEDLAAVEVDIVDVLVLVELVIHVVDISRLLFEDVLVVGSDVVAEDW